MKSWLPLGLVAVGLAVTSGCVVEADHHGAGDSTLRIDWTIDGTSDPAACDDTGAAYAYVLVESPHATEYEDELPCDEFGVDVILPGGSYSVTVVLRDSRDRDITEAAEAPPRDLFDGDDDHVVLDFPEDSFL
jgi:hypothetical protein